MPNIPKLRFLGFDGSWEERKLSSITSLITKGTTPVNKTKGGEVNFIKVENINPSSGNIMPIQKITMEEHCKHLKRSKLQEGDILFSIAGTLGRVTTIKKEYLPANTNQALAIIRLNEGDLRYVSNYLKSSSIVDYVRKNPTIGAQPNLSLTQLRNLTIMMPSEPEQKKIGELFSLLEQQIELQESKVMLTKKAKLSLMHDVFQQTIMLPNSTNKWNLVDFSDVFKIIPTKPYQIPSSQIEEYGKYAVIDQGKNTIAGYTNNYEKLYTNGSAIIYGDHTTNIKYREEPFVIGADGTKLLCSKDHENNLKYLFYALTFYNVNSEGYKRHFSILKKIQIPLPSTVEQNEVASFLSLQDKIIELNEKNYYY